MTALRSSKYSIHDLSRCKGEGDLNTARFNMPLELGIAMAERFNASSNDDSHDWLVLVPKGHVYQRFVSDLSGYDPVEYDGSRASVISAVMAWLATRPDAVQCPTPNAVAAILPQFDRGLSALREKWNAYAPWADTLALAVKIALDAELIPRMVAAGKQ